MVAIQFGSGSHTSLLLWNCAHGPHNLLPSPPPLPMARPPGMKNHAPPPPFNGPPFGNEESWPPEGVLLKNPVFWLILWLQSVASRAYKIILVIKGKYIMDRSACFLCLNSIVYCVLPLLELPRPKDFQSP